MEDDWDVIVIGGGPAGLSAALMLGRARRRTLVLDAGEPRNRFAAHMHGVLGQESVPPGDLLARGRAEAAGYAVQLVAATVGKVESAGTRVRVATAERAYTARAVIVATGLTDDLPDIPGLAARWASTVLHCPYCHGWEVRDQRLGVLARPPMGQHQAELVRQWSDDVVVFTAGIDPLDEASQQRLRARGVELVAEPVQEISDAGSRLAVHLADGQTVVVDAIFTAGAARPHDGFLSHLDLARTQNPLGSFLAVDPAGRTSDPRLWAVGNVVNPTANVPMSIGAGALTGGAVNGALVSEDFDNAVQGVRA